MAFVPAGSRPAVGYALWALGCIVPVGQLAAWQVGWCFT